MSQAFLSYAREDVDRVRSLHNELRQYGVSVWFDQTHLTAGTWMSQIQRAIAQSRYFVFCLSRAALEKMKNPSGTEDELSQAFYIAMRQSEQSFTIVPVRLEDVDRGDQRLEIYQQFDLFEDWSAGVAKLARALNEVRELPQDAQIAAALMGKVRTLYELGSYAQIPALVTSAEHLVGETFESRNAIASTLHAMGSYQEALVEFDRLLQKEPGSATLWFNHSQVLRSIGRSAEAWARRDRSLELDPSRKSLTNRAVLLYTLGRQIEAYDVVSRALVVAPTDSNFLTVRAQLHLDTDDWEYARADAAAARTSSPSFAPAHEIEGIALWKLGRFAEAAERLDRAFHIGSNSLQALEARGVVALELEQYETAIRTYESIRAQGGASWLGGLQAAYLGQGKRKETFDLLDDLLARNPTEPDLWVNRGYNHLLWDGDTAAALSDFERALQLDPSNERALEGRATAKAR